MKFKLVYSPEFKNDVEIAVDYYHQINPNLASYLKKSIKNSCLEINKHPEFQIRYKHIRCLLIRTFPDMIHYYIDEKLSNIYILALISTHQNPDTKWIK